VVDALERVGLPYLVVDFNHDAIAAALEEGRLGIWGDVASADIQRAAALPQARMLVMAIPEWHAIRVGIEQAKRLNPRIFVIARATALAHVEDLRALRVDAVVQPEFEGGIEMVRRALTQCERRDEEIDQVTAALRRALYEPRMEG
jgi:CPA2 family monovalent cation:H+ antiporter-2